MGKICYNCFAEIEESVCPHCGYDPAADEGKYPLALKPGSILNGRYIVGRVLGQGGFGITYIAQDYNSKERVAIKEYLPAEFAGRAEGTNMVRVHSADIREYFDFGKEQFLAEAKTLAAFIGNEHIVRIHSYFEENETAYLAMEYVDGVGLDKYMSRNYGGRLPVEKANELLLPVMEALDWVHSKGIVHRDIAPDNILITRDGTAKLIDFGAARYSTGEKSKSLDVILKHGFAPKEQYTRRGRQGPFTDVYAMAATYYYAITGRIPPEAIDRIDEDEIILPSTVGVKISEATEDALLRALSVSSGDRFQSMHDFHAAMTESMSGKTPKLPVTEAAPEVPEMTKAPEAKKTAAVTTQPTKAPDDAETRVYAPAKEKDRKKLITILASAAAVLVLSLLGLGTAKLLSRSESVEKPAAAETPAVVTAAPTPKSAAVKEEKPASVEEAPVELGWDYDNGTDSLTVSLAEDMEKLTAGAAPWEEHKGSLEALSLTGSVTDVSASAFTGYRALREVTMADGVRTVGDGAFADCTRMADVTLPKSLEEIGNNAFENCGSLRQVVIPGAVREIRSGAFAGCDALESVTVPESVTAMGEGAFKDCTSLNYMRIAGRIKEIPASAFENCRSLYGAAIADGTETIGANAFASCGNLKSITIPGTLTTVEENAFAGCTTLATVYFTGTKDQWNHMRFEEGNAFLQGAELFCLDGQEWNFNPTNGILVIAGQGDMHDYSDADPAPWAEHRGRIKDVRIADGVTTVADSAFYKCSLLNRISIPYGVTKIGKNTFEKCEKLKEAVLPYTLTEIGDKAFLECGVIGVLDIPSGVKSIGDMAFSGCRSLKSLTIPAGVTALGSEMCRNCQALADITLPAGLDSIGQGAFTGCVHLAEVYYLGTEKEWNNVSGSGAVPQSASMTYMTGDGWYYIQPKRLLIISGKGDMANYSDTSAAPWSKHKKNAETVWVLEGVTGIGAYAFNRFEALTDVVLPDSVTKIGNGAFAGSIHLKQLRLPDAVSSIGREAFSGCNSLQSIRIPAKVSNLGEGAFSGCASLSEAGIQYGVTDIKNQTFLKCGSLKNIELPESVTKVGESAFAGCTRLQSAVLPTGLESLGSYAFADCSTLKSIAIHGRTQSIGEYAFSGCTALTEVTIEDGMRRIGTNAFAGCSDLAVAELPDSISEIGYAAFYECSALKAINIPKALTEISYNTFYACTSLETVNLPESVVTIGSSAFERCAGLKYLTIPSSVTKVSSYAFKGCSGLVDVQYLGTQDQWDRMSIGSGNEVMWRKGITYAK